MPRIANHSLCLACWMYREGERPATRIVRAREEPCCDCGKANADGIYQRGAQIGYPACKGHG